MVNHSFLNIQLDKKLHKSLSKSQCPQSPCIPGWYLRYLWLTFWETFKNQNHPVDNKPCILFLKIRRIWRNPPNFTKCVLYNHLRLIFKKIYTCSVLKTKQANEHWITLAYYLLDARILFADIKKTGITSSSLYMENLKIMRFFPIFSWFFIKLLPHHLFTAAIKKHWFQLKWIKMKKKKAVIKLCPKNFFNYRLFEVDLYYWEAPRYRGFNEKDF